MTTPIAKGQLLQLQMIERWFDTNVELMRNEVLKALSQEIEERPPINVSLPFLAYLFDCAFITTLPDERMLFMGCEVKPVDDAAFVWEVA
jgi:hypothetical protein